MIFTIEMESVLNHMLEPPTGSRISVSLSFPFQMTSIASDGPAPGPDSALKCEEQMTEMAEMQLENGLLELAGNIICENNNETVSKFSSGTESGSDVTKEFNRYLIASEDELAKSIEKQATDAIESLYTPLLSCRLGYSCLQRLLASYRSVCTSTQEKLALLLVLTDYIVASFASPALVDTFRQHRTDTSRLKLLKQLSSEWTNIFKKECSAMLESSQQLEKEVTVSLHSFLRRSFLKLQSVWPIYSSMLVSSFSNTFFWNNGLSSIDGIKFPFSPGKEEHLRPADVRCVQERILPQPEDSVVVSVSSPAAVAATSKNDVKEEKCNSVKPNKTTAAQVERLQAEFALSHYPDPARKAMLSDELEMPIARVRNWFCNARSKLKKRQVKQELLDRLERKAKSKENEVIASTGGETLSSNSSCETEQEQSTTCSSPSQSASDVNSGDSKFSTNSEVGIELLMIIDDFCYQQYHFQAVLEPHHGLQTSSTFPGPKSGACGINEISRQVWDQAEKENPELSMEEVAQIVAKKWCDLPDEEKFTHPLLPPFLQFSRRVWDQVEQEKPELSMWGVAQKVARMWCDLPDEEKSEFTE